MASRQGRTEARERPGGIQVIARAAAILRALSGHPQGLSLGAIAQEVNLPRSTVQRIITALEQEGLVLSAGTAGSLRLGPELGRLFFQTQMDMISVVRPLLEELSGAVRESVVLCGREKDQIIVLDRVVPTRTLRVVFPVGILRVPMHTSAAGKALLASLGDEQVEELLPASLRTSAADRGALLRELAEVRRQGIAAEQDVLEGLSSFATAVDTYFGHFAIALVAPSSRIDLQRFSEALRQCRNTIESRIGGRHPG